MRKWLHNSSECCYAEIKKLEHRVYSHFAKINLISHHLSLSLPAAKIVADPEKALHLLPSAIVKAFFLSGYRSAMLLLVFISLLAFFLVLIGMKKIKTKHASEHLML